MRRGLIVLFGLIATGCFANAAFAGQSDPSTGYIEVCKASAPAPLAVTGPFSFTITDSGHATHTVSVTASAAGAPLSCSSPISVAAGAATVVETANPWSAVTSIADEPGSSVVSNTNLATGTATVNVTAGTTDATAATAVYTDQLVTGVVEVCKSAVTESNLTGTYQYTITGGDGFSTTASAPVGDCTLPITVPAGQVTVQEGPAPVDVTSITATSQGINELLNGSNVAAGTAIVGVQAGPSSMETIVTYTDDVTTLKLCKAWDGPAPTPGPFPFTFSDTGPAGPNGPTTGLSVAAGTVAAPNCVIVGQFRAGTQVAITEAGTAAAVTGTTPGAVAGTKVESISVNPSGNVVPGTLNTTTGTVTVSMGAGETVVTYVDEPALAGTLKICKLAGAMPPVGSGVFTFTVDAGTSASKTLQVPLNQCVIAGTSYAYNSVHTITEMASAGNAVSAIAVSPTSSASTSASGAPNLTAGTVSVVIGENDVTEVTYTDIDPPAAAPVAPTGGSTTTGGSTSTGGTSNNSSGGGSTGSGASTGATTGLTPSVLGAISPNGAAGLGTVGTLGTGGTSSSAAKTAAATKAALVKALKLKTLKKELANLKLSEKKTVARHAAAKTRSVKLALAKKITTIKAAEKKLTAEIARLK